MFIDEFILQDVDCDDFEILLEYMYMGEAAVDQLSLSRLIRTAERLQIRGLAGSDNNTQLEADNLAMLEAAQQQHTTFPGGPTKPVGRRRDGHREGSVAGNKDDNVSADDLNQQKSISGKGENDVKKPSSDSNCQRNLMPEKYNNSAQKSARNELPISSPFTTDFEDSGDSADNLHIQQQDQGHLDEDKETEIGTQVSTAKRKPPVELASSRDDQNTPHKRAKIMEDQEKDSNEEARPNFMTLLSVSNVILLDR